MAREGGLGDAGFVVLVTRRDDAVAAVDGHGFVVTPAIEAPELAEAAGLDVNLFVKVEVDNVGGSHKARHLFGVALRFLVDEALGAEPACLLAIASCGNAALGAGVIARALDRPLKVFVPTGADPAVLGRTGGLGAALPAGGLTGGGAG